MTQRRNVEIKFRLDEKEAEKLNDFVRRTGMPRERILRAMIGSYKLNEPNEDFMLAIRELSNLANAIWQFVQTFKLKEFRNTDLAEKQLEIWSNVYMEIYKKYLFPEKEKTPWQ